MLGASCLPPEICLVQSALDQEDDGAGRFSTSLKQRRKKNAASKHFNSMPDKITVGVFAPFAAHPMGNPSK
jgi:hypothetical protein